MKKLFIVTLALVLLCTGTAFAAELSFTSAGEPYTPYPDAILQNDVTMVPVSVITDCLDIDVKADSKNGTLLLIKNSHEVLVDVAKNELTINSQAVKPQKDLLVNEEHIYVPLRQITEALGGTVTWDAANFVIDITLPKL